LKKYGQTTLEFNQALETYLTKNKYLET